MKTVIVDAVGEPCPIPVVKATKALREMGEPGTLEIRVDNEIAVDSETMGRGSDELGKLLMKSFLFAVSQLPRLPRTVLFYNGGAKLTVEGSESLEDLRNMEAQGVEILTCGTCLNFYGLAEKLAVGGVTNMYAIVEALANAGKVIKP